MRSKQALVFLFVYYFLAPSFAASAELKLTDTVKTEVEFVFQVSVSELATNSNVKYWFFAEEERSGWIWPQTAGEIGSRSSYDFEWAISRVGGYPFDLYVAALSPGEWKMVEEAMNRNVPRIHRNDINFSKVGNVYTLTRDGLLR